MNMHAKRALLWGLLLYIVISTCSPLMATSEVLIIPIANFVIAQAIFWGIADHQICFFGIAGLLTVIVLIGVVGVKRNCLGSLCGAFVVVGDLFYAGSMFVSDWLNSHINTLALQASLFDASVTLLYILYYVGQIKERNVAHRSSRIE